MHRVWVALWKVGNNSSRFRVKWQGDQSEFKSISEYQRPLDIGANIMRSIESTCNFLTHIMALHNHCHALGKTKLEALRQKLLWVLVINWPDTNILCIQVNDQHLDPLITLAAKLCKIDPRIVHHCFPRGCLFVRVQDQEVSYEWRGDGNDPRRIFKRALQTPQDDSPWYCSCQDHVEDPKEQGGWWKTLKDFLWPFFSI